MRCYFVKDARIVAVEQLPGLSIKDAVESARIIFEKAASFCDEIEVWSLTRRIYKQDRGSHPQKTETTIELVEPSYRHRLSLGPSITGATCVSANKRKRPTAR